ncbi:MAG: SOS response-associated peptidase [Hyphomicrobiales bacterium]
MCGRTTLTERDVRTLAEALGVGAESLEGWEPRFNIAPTQEHFILRLRGEDREVVRARWGIATRWEGGSATSRAFNARAETLDEKPSFQRAFERRRCLVPADGFYEWEGGPGGRRPHWFHRPDGRLLLFAGLYEFEARRGAAPECTFTIITTRANETVARLHDRMPVILDERDADEWMFEKTAATRAKELLQPTPDGWLASRPVSKAVNNVLSEGPGLIERAEEQARLF